ncbi:MAG: phosphonate ABC transporter, permease protein PhnE, partial [Rhodocyclaceae bacterium]|nr:phosphonate ABC transporter, permease protein PhnE [Rhodocyclaceae bacterium]
MSTNIQRQWVRFTPEQRFLRFAFYFLSVAAMVFSLKNIEIIPEFLYDAPEQLADFFQ